MDEHELNARGFLDSNKGRAVYPVGQTASCFTSEKKGTLTDHFIVDHRRQGVFASASVDTEASWATHAAIKGALRAAPRIARTTTWANIMHSPEVEDNEGESKPEESQQERSQSHMRSRGSKYGREPSSGLSSARSRESCGAR